MLAIVNTPGGRTGRDPRGRRARAAPNEALVAVHAFSLNRGELRLFQMRPEGWRPGQDIAGVVRAAAADGSGPAAGTRVVALTDKDGWAERAAVPSAPDGRIADNVSFEEAAAPAGRRSDRAAQLASRRAAARQAGADHRCGRRGRQLAVQIAARSGARVTAIVGGPERGRHLRLGAAEIVKASIRREGRFALILEAAGGASLAAAIERVEARGTVVDLRQFVGRADRGQLPRLRRASERPHPGFSLFHLRARGPLRPRSGAAGRAGRRTARSNLRTRRTQLA